MDDPFATTATVKVCFLIYTHDLDTTRISNLLELQPLNVKPYRPLISRFNNKTNEFFIFHVPISYLFLQFLSANYLKLIILINNPELYGYSCRYLYHMYNRI